LASAFPRPGLIEGLADQLERAVGS
jgi:hypothetical protein